MRRKETKISWWIIFILILAALVRIIPQEWIIGPPPTPENNYNQAEYQQSVSTLQNVLPESLKPSH